MALPRALRNISLILFVIVMKCHTSTTRADDDNDDFQNNEDTSEEYTEPQTRRRRSGSSALFSTVATMRAMSRPPRGNKNDYINGTLCGSNGEYYLHYANTQEIVAANAKLVHNSYCDIGCGKSQPDPCRSRMPVCTGSEGNYSVFKNECEVNKVSCERLENDLEPLIIADPSNCQLESCDGQPQPKPCPRRVPVCAGYPGDYRVYEDECKLNETRCNIQGNDLKPIHTTKIGKCQTEGNETKLTCHAILRAKCPRGTLKDKVCDVKANKTYRNICRALHKRCKKQDDTCYHVNASCGSYYSAKNNTFESNPSMQDCSQYIEQISFPIVDVGRPCYMSASKRATPNCTCGEANIPDIPEFPKILNETLNGTGSRQ